MDNGQDIKDVSQAIKEDIKLKPAASAPASSSSSSSYRLTTHLRTLLLGSRNDSKKSKQPQPAQPIEKQAQEEKKEELKDSLKIDIGGLKGLS